MQQGMSKRQSGEMILKSKGRAGPADPATTRTSLRAAPAASPRIGALLIDAGFVHDTGVHRALAAHEDRLAVRLGSVLVARGEIDEDEVYRALSEQLGVAYVRLGEFDVEAAALASLPADIARARRVLPLMFYEGQLVIATDDPADNDKLSALRFRTQKPIEIVLAPPADLDTAIATHYPLIEDAALDSEADRLRRQRIEPMEPPVECLAQQKPIVRLINNMLLNAIQRRASDIHLHPREHCADVRCRIDGSLVAVGEFNRAQLPAVVARIKVLATTDLAEHRLPQDGAIHMSTPHGPVDMRVSVMPAVHGENVVIRILDPSVRLRRLVDVGFSAADERRFHNQLEARAAEEGMVRLAVQALGLARAGVISLNEAFRARLD